MWRWALQDSLTILALLPELLVNIAQRVPMPFGMSMINTYFWKLKLSEYQPIVCGIPPQNWKTQFGKVMNRKRSCIVISTAGPPVITTHICNELKFNASLTSIEVGAVCSSLAVANGIAEHIRSSTSLTQVLAFITLTLALTHPLTA